MNIMEHFTVDFENAASVSYQVLIPDGEYDIINYQIEMIGENELRGVLPVELRQKNGIKYLYYNITSKMVLSQFLKRKVLNKKEFLDMLESINKSLLECKNYLLSDRQFVIQDEFIYINPSTQEIFMIYLPVAVQQDANCSFKEFIIDLITRKANIEEGSNDNYLQKLLNYIKTDTFNITELQKLLMELKSSEREMENTVTSEKETLEKVQPEIPKKKTAPDMEDLRQEVNIPEQSQHVLGEIAIPQSSSRVPNDKRSKFKQCEKKVENKNLRYKTSTIITVIIAQVVLIGGYIGAAASGFFLSLTGDAVSAYGSTAIIAAAADLLLLRKLFNVKNKVKQEIQPKVRMDAKEIRSVSNHAAVHKQEPESQQVNAFQASISSSAAANEESMLSLSEAEETTLLGEEKRQNAVLQAVKSGIVEEISITKPHFMIGRLREQVDYICQNRAVGKVHAEVISRDGQYFVKDLNSKNGTYINNARIDSNKEYAIQDDDKVSFANSEYTFIAPQ